LWRSQSTPKEELQVLTLISRAIVGFLFLMFVLALALFLPAGSLGFWRAWVYLGVFAVCTVLITIYLTRNDPGLLAGRVRAGPVAEGEKSQRIIQSLASLFFIGMYIVSGFDYRYDWSNIPGSLSLLADVLVALGFFFVFLVFRENSYTSSTVQVAEGQRVVTTGPYSLVRHPMYAGAGLLVIVTPVALGSWVAIPLAVGMMLVIVVRLREEEKLLANSLAGYKEYCDKVHHRLIPFIW
jgi:protein-S-isoprenylcysteine O-methyltransferase Ste14